MFYIYNKKVISLHIFVILKCMGSDFGKLTVKSLKDIGENKVC